MSLWAAAFLLAAAWSLLHLLHFLTNRPESSLLPTQSHTLARRRPPLFSPLPRLTVTLKGLQLHVSTTRWNTAHDKLGSLLSRRGHRTLAASVRGFYTLGALLGAVGMLAAVLALCWVCITTGWACFEKVAGASRDVGSTVPPDMQRLGRRSADFSEGEGSALPAAGAAGASFLTITPIVRSSVLCTPFPPMVNCRPPSYDLDPRRHGPPEPSARPPRCGVYRAGGS